jgi:excinuclease UvrABC nuclease subunit
MNGDPLKWETLDAFLRRAEDSTAVYRAYDHSGKILYVGVSDEPGKRFSKHEAAGLWFDRCRRLEIDWYDSRSEALMHEARLIHELQPKYNRGSL